MFIIRRPRQNFLAPLQSHFFLLSLTKTRSPLFKLFFIGFLRPLQVFGAPWSFLYPKYFPHHRTLIWPTHGTFLQPNNLNSKFWRPISWRPRSVICNGLADISDIGSPGTMGRPDMQLIPGVINLTKTSCEFSAIAKQTVTGLFTDALFLPPFCPLLTPFHNLFLSPFCPFLHPFCPVRAPFSHPFFHFLPLFWLNVRLTSTWTTMATLTSM